MKWARGVLAGAFCVGALWGGVVPAAQAAAPEPDFVLTPAGGLSGSVLNGPCGLAVDGQGRLYIANHYEETIEVFPFALGVRVPMVGFLGVGGPCGLAVDSQGKLYANNYHHGVEPFLPSVFPITSSTTYAAGTAIDSSHPTGVAVDPAGDVVFVNARTHLNAYDATGAPLLDGPDPLRIGSGSLGDGYGLATSSHPATAGRIYVPDHVDDTVKVYDPAVDEDDPVQVIAGPPGGFGSLRDAAIAVDDVTGEVYVADTRAYPQYSERPEVTVYVFEADGSYGGRLKYNVIDGSPVGLAVDNSGGPAQSRVYVTSGNTVSASVYAYPPGAATAASAPPLAGTAAQTAPIDHLPVAADSVESRAHGEGEGAAASVAAQKGTLRVTVDGRLAPRRLPRRGSAPISVSVGGEIATTDGSMPPQLKRIQIELHRGGRLDTRGLPPCEYDRIQPGSSQRALSACGDSLVGQGSFTADITLAGQEPYPTGGKMLLFHSVEKGKPVLYGHIYSARPFATSFVIVFAVRRIAKGTYGTAFDAPMPKAMDAWGRLTGLQMTLERRYSHAGKRHSFLSAGCPAPKGFSAAAFALARTEFSFAGGAELRSTLTSQCRVRRE